MYLLWIFRQLGCYILLHLNTTLLFTCRLEFEVIRQMGCAFSVWCMTCCSWRLSQHGGRGRSWGLGEGGRVSCLCVQSVRVGSCEEMQVPLPHYNPLAFSLRTIQSGDQPGTVNCLHVSVSITSFMFSFCWEPVPAVLQLTHNGVDIRTSTNKYLTILSRTVRPPVSLVYN